MSGNRALPSIGFLTVRKYEELGLIGAYLLLNTLGRPREFHCTAPVRPNRAQEILYGPTLEPFLVGEQIAHTLVKSGKETPLFVCTDDPAVLPLRHQIEQPVLLVRDPGRFPERSTTVPSEGEAPAARPRLCRPQFQLDEYFVELDPQHAQDQQTVESLWISNRGELDLLEPFVRLAEAIEETQRGARAA